MFDKVKKKYDKHKRETKAFDSYAKGYRGEKRFEHAQKIIHDKHVVRTGEGHDYTVQSRDKYGVPRGPKKYVEVKSGPNAKLSPLQKQKQEEYGNRYQVVHYNKKKKRR